MSKSKIVITAGLQINGADGSVAQIKQDLKKITEKLNREKAFKVQCSIDTSSDSISAMQAQLDKVSEKLSLNISNVNIGKLNVRSIQEAIDNQTKDMTVQAKVETTVDSGSVNKASQQIAKEIENATQTNIKLNEKRTQNRQYAYVFTEGSTDNILQSAKDTLNAQFKEWGTGDVATRVKRATEDSTQELQRFTVQVEKQNGATETLIYQLDEVSKRYEYLGKTIREADNSTAFRRKGVDVQKEIQGLNLDKIENQLKSYGLYTKEFENALTGLREELAKVNDTNGINQYLDNLDIFRTKLSSAREELKLASQDESRQNGERLEALREIENAYKKVNHYTKTVMSPTASDSEKAVAHDYVSQYNDTINSTINRLNNEGLLTQELKEQIQLYERLSLEERETLDAKLENYNLVKKEAEKTKLANQEEEQTNRRRLELTNEIVNAYKQLSKYEKIIYSTNATPLEQMYAQGHISDYQEIIDLSRERLYAEKLITEEVQKQIQDSAMRHAEERKILEDKLDIYNAEKAIAEAAKAAANELRKERDFAHAQKSLGSGINTSINQLSSQLNNAVFRNNSNNDLVTTQIAQINTLLNRYHQLETELSTVTTPESLVEIQNEINKLAPVLTTITRESKKLQTELRKDDASKTLNNRIQKLTADMNAFAIANRKAISSTQQMSDGSTFADKWIQLSKQMARGTELNADELRHLQEEFRIFGKEAETAGLKGQSTLQKFLGQFKQMTTYITAQAVWSFAKREISSMIEEVRNLDAAMINLKKVTDETDSGYDRFTQTAQKQAKQLHMTTTDVVEQTAEWAKLGYNIDQATELAKNSMIYSKVGEVDNKTAVSDLVTSIKAFNIEASDSIEIVDKLNILGNNFSTASADLGEGLRVSSSALSAAGNDINQTLALITGGTEIIQNASQVGEALRTISMRIRGKKYASV